MVDEAKLSGFNLFSDEIKELFSKNKKVFKKEDLMGAYGIFVTDDGPENMNPICLDDEYNIVDLDTFNAILKASRTNRFHYEKFFDCDKFSRLFQAECFTLELNSVGMVIDWGARHSYNLVPYYKDNNELEFVIIEPQADQEVKVHQGIYQFKKGIVIF